MKEIVDKLDFIEIKNLCSERDNVKRRRNQATGWEKVFANTFWSRSVTDNRTYLIQDCYLKCTENSQNSKIRKQMEKILANHISDKELILLNGKNIQGTHTTQ